MATRLRLATICQSGLITASVEENRERVAKLVDLALKVRPDLLCLPESFAVAGCDGLPSEQRAEIVPGPTTDYFARKARKGRCYIICPLITRREGACYNSAVLLGREGEIIGIYDKAHPVTTSHDYTVMESGITPGPEDIPVFDLDFGRVGIQICFDLGFPKSWAQLAEKGARLVVWPSAYEGGFPLRLYAYLHHYWVASSVRGAHSKLINPLGELLEETTPINRVIWRDINLDYMVAHWDFNFPIMEAARAAYGDRVNIRVEREAAHFLLEPSDPTLTTEQIIRELGVEPLAQYLARHEAAYEALRRGEATPPQQAAHGDRPEWGW